MFFIIFEKKKGFENKSQMVKRKFVCFFILKKSLNILKWINVFFKKIEIENHLIRIKVL